MTKKIAVLGAGSWGWLVFATGSLVDGTFGVVFSASVAGRTKSLPWIVA